MYSTLSKDEYLLKDYTGLDFKNQMLDQLISLEWVIFYIGAYVTLFALHSIIIIKPYQTPSNHIEQFALH